MFGERVKVGGVYSIPVCLGRTNSVSIFFSKYVHIISYIIYIYEPLFTQWIYMNNIISKTLQNTRPFIEQSIKPNAFVEKSLKFLTNVYIYIQVHSIMMKSNISTYNMFFFFD